MRWTPEEHSLIADVMQDSGAPRSVVIKELIDLRMLTAKAPAPRPPFSPRIAPNSPRLPSRPASARPNMGGPMVPIRVSFMGPRPASAPRSPRVRAHEAAVVKPKKKNNDRWETTADLAYPNYAKTHKHIYQPQGISEAELAELTALKQELYDQEHRMHLQLTPDELSAEIQKRTHHSDVFHRKPLPKWLAANACDVVRPVDESRYTSKSRRPGDNRPPWQYC